MYSLGYHLGNFLMQEGKVHQYEFDTRVPTLIKGPGIAPGVPFEQPAGNVDVSPAAPFASSAKGGLTSRMLVRADVLGHRWDPAASTDGRQVRAAAAAPADGRRPQRARRGVELAQGLPLRV